MSAALFIQATLTAYIVTLVIAEGYIAKPFRRIFREFASDALPLWMAKHVVKYDTMGERADREGFSRHVVFTDEKETPWEPEHEYAGYDFIACRLCVGAWVTQSFAIWWIPLEWLLPVWAASWILTRQER